jgi:hypothetical protein
VPSTAALTSLNEQNPTETGENLWPVSVTPSIELTPVPTVLYTNSTGVLVVGGVVATTTVGT